MVQLLNTRFTHNRCRGTGRSPPGRRIEQLGERHEGGVVLSQVVPQFPATQQQAPVIRRSGSARRSATAISARGTASWPTAICRRKTERTSRSISSGAASRSARKLARDASPSALSSARAGGRTLASTTITILPKDRCGCRDRYPSTFPAARAVEHLFHGRDGGLVDQPAQQVLLPGRPLVAAVRPRTGRGCRRH